MSDGFGNRSLTYEVTVVPGIDLDAVRKLRGDLSGADTALSNESDARLAWLYEMNPAGPADVLAAYASNGQCAGMVAIVPRYLWVDGIRHRGAFLCDFLVHPLYRTALPALMLQRAARHRLQSRGVLSYAIPNRRAVSILMRVGADRTVARYRWVRPLRSANWLERHKIYCAPLASRLIDASTLLWDRANALLARAVQAEWLDSVDDRFDAHWDRVPKIGNLIGERTQDYLRWRFQSEPERKNLILAFTDRQTTKLEAYLIGEISQREFVVRDLLATGPEQLIPRGILALALLKLRELDIDVVSFKNLAKISCYRSLRALGFRGSDPEVAFLHGVSELQPSDWYLTCADEDV